MTLTQTAPATRTALAPGFTFAREEAPVPPCPECSVGLHAVGAGRHRYWSCAYCGITMPRP